MIIHNLDLMCAGFPSKANPPLIVNAEAILTGAPTFQRFQSVSRRHRHILQSNGRVQLQQLSPGRSLNIGRQSP
jgi:hypothetical protein